MRAHINLVGGVVAQTRQHIECVGDAVDALASRVGTETSGTVSDVPRVGGSGPRFP